jgi:tryptophan-rich sensory protein
VLLENLAISAGLIAFCVLVHAAGTALMMQTMRSQRGMRWRAGKPYHVAGTLIYVVFGLLVMSAIEIMAYAWLYYALQEFPDWESSIYFAASTYTTLGYGDIFIDSARRMIAAVEGVLGLILIGWSSAILFAVTARMGAFDVHRDREPPHG